MKKIFTLLSLLLVLNVQAQIDFESNVIINEEFVIDGPTQIFAEDMYGDGDKDILVISSDNQITLYENIDGVLNSKTVLPSSQGDLRYADLGDIDGDGDMDIVTTKKSNNNTAAFWFQNLGGGEFIRKNYPYQIAGDIDIVKLADMDGDGDLDILAARDIKTYWYENTDGAGNFEYVDDISSTTDMSELEIADIDGNGFPDLIYSSDEGSSLKIIQNTNGVLTSSAYETSLVNADGITASDIDGDGDIDLLITSLDNGTFGIAYNNGGNFSALQTLESGLSQVYSSVVADLNNDNQPDLVLSSFEEVYVYYNEGSSFTQGTLIAEGSALTMIDVNDIDNDGDNDLMSCSLISNRASLYYSENDVIGPEKNIISYPRKPEKIVLEDLDNDGDLDILISSSGDDKVSWLTNMNGRGKFSHLRIISENVDGVNDILVEDFNGDGRLDVVAASQFDDKITLFENLGGDNYFSEDKIITNQCDGAKAVKTGDINSDGITDIIYACENSKSIIWKAGIAGSTNFGPDNIITDDITQASTLAVGDVDSDGDLDVITAGNSLSGLNWFENLGGGLFSNKLLIDGGVSLVDVHLIDFEGDGDLDIILGEGGSLKLYLNEDGQANWASEPILIINSLLDITSILPYDIDEDGGMDLITTSNFSDAEFNAIWAFDGSPISLFSQFERTALEDPIYYAAAGDIDQDGDLDLVTCGFWANGLDLDDHVTWIDNRTITVGTETLTEESENTFLYPNPTNELLFIKSDKEIRAVEIIDLSGKSMPKTTLSGNIDCSNLSSGMYFCRILFENDSQKVLKFVKK